MQSLTTTDRAGATVMPCLQYRNANAAIRWLTDVFGFTEHAVYRDDQGEVVHGQLIVGNGMLMVGSRKETDYGQLITSPAETGGRHTQSIYVVTRVPDEVFARVRASGVKVHIAIKDEDYGGRGFTCEDVEGHLWSFGSYDPWAAH